MIEQAPAAAPIFGTPIRGVQFFRRPQIPQYNSAGWLHLAARAMGDKALRRHYGITEDKVLGEVCRLMAGQAVTLWRERWICPACGAMRPEHRMGCQVFAQLGAV